MIPQTNQSEGENGESPKPNYDRWSTHLTASELIFIGFLAGVAWMLVIIGAWRW
jgi:hypothetical protein